MEERETPPQVTSPPTGGSAGRVLPLEPPSLLRTCWPLGVKGGYREISQHTSQSDPESRPGLVKVEEVVVSELGSGA